MRKPLAFLEGRPIYEGDWLCDKEGTLLCAQPSIHRYYALAMVSERGRWLTNTHWEGKQVLFWEKPEKWRPAKNWPWA